jgi:SAM-dependent methyltransferase
MGRPFSWLSEGLSWRVRALLQKARGAKTALGITVRHAIDFSESETKLIGDSQTYWNTQSDQSLKQNSHWRGVGIFADDLRWLTLGREHLQLYEEFARALDLKHSPKRIVEWGCGGGMNAVHFGRFADEFYGIDISSSSLGECGKQMAEAGLHNFTPVLIDAAKPEAALRHVQDPCDFFISTYVFELLPTPEYGIRILRIAYELLAPGGIAIIQIKYSECNAKTRSRAWAYARNLAWNATYRIEDFWQAAQQCGFTPKMVTLLPQQPLVNDRNYAYFLLQKKTVAMDGQPDER